MNTWPSRSLSGLQSPFYFLDLYALHWERSVKITSKQKWMRETVYLSSSLKSFISCLNNEKWSWVCVCGKGGGAEQELTWAEKFHPHFPGCGSSWGWRLSPSSVGREVLSSERENRTPLLGGRLRHRSGQDRRARLCHAEVSFPALSDNVLAEATLYSLGNLPKQYFNKNSCFF